MGWPQFAGDNKIFDLDLDHIFVNHRLMGPFQHILRINQEILSSPRYQARSVSNPPPIVHTTRTEKLNHEVGEDWETRAS